MSDSRRAAIGRTWGRCRRRSAGWATAWRARSSGQPCGGQALSLTTFVAQRPATVLQDHRGASLLSTRPSPLTSAFSDARKFLKTSFVGENHYGVHRSLRSCRSRRHRIALSAVPLEAAAPQPQQRDGQREHQTTERLAASIVSPCCHLSAWVDAHSTRRQAHLTSFLYFLYLGCRRSFPGGTPSEHR